MTVVVSLDVSGWRPALPPGAQDTAIRAIEDGGVLVLPHVNFAMSDAERRFLSPKWSDGRAKNISVERRNLERSDAQAGIDDDSKVVLKGAHGSADDMRDLAAMVTRFAGDAATLVTTFFPRYAPYVRQARTSFRPQPAVGRKVSWRKDDSRLHVDAFPSRPNRGERILRVFSNLHPTAPRVWRVGESFETMARTLMPSIRAPLPGSAMLLHALRVTKSPRSHYDHLMLQLHDGAKADLAYQRDCAQQVLQFAPGATWLCFSDQVMHAAVSGQFMLEQTIHLPLAALYDPSRSPLAILERLVGRRLVPSLD